MLRLSQNNYVGLKSDLPERLHIGSTFVTTDTAELYIYNWLNEPKQAVTLTVDPEAVRLDANNTFTGALNKFDNGIKIGENAGFGTFFRQLSGDSWETYHDGSGEGLVFWGGSSTAPQISFRGYTSCFFKQGYGTGTVIGTSGILTLQDAGYGTSYFKIDDLSVTDHYWPTKPWVRAYAPGLEEDNFFEGTNKFVDSLDIRDSGDFVSFLKVDESSSYTNITSEINGLYFQAAQGLGSAFKFNGLLESGAGATGQAGAWSMPAATIAKIDDVGAEAITTREWVVAYVAAQIALIP